MTKKDDSLNLTKLEDDPIWKEACDIAEYVYSLLDQFPEDEKWYSVTKLKSASNDLMFFAAQACSSKMPPTQQYDWDHMRRALGSLRTMYRFVAARRKYVALEPEIMVRMSKLNKEVDKRLQKAHKEAKKLNREEMDQWRKKYQLWKEANEYKDRAIK